MKLRTLLSGAIALALVGAGTLATSATADEEVINADVGGGAAGIQAFLLADTPVLNVVDQDYVEVTHVYPRVVLGKDGGNPQAKFAVNQTVGPVKVKSLYQKISGARNGKPAFATAQSLLKGIDIAGTKIGALDVVCTWDRAGARGTTTVTDAAGTVYQPAPNTETVIPGIGVLVLNEQYFEGVYQPDPTIPDGPPNYGERYFPSVIYVVGAHLFLYADVAETLGVVDIQLGVTSCDPVKLPPLSGLKLGSNDA